MKGMLNLMNLPLAESFAADAERRWLYGHPYRVDRTPRRPRTAVRRHANARGPRAALRRLRTA
jgi:hypothetical protein